MGWLIIWRKKESCFRLVDKTVSQIKFEIEQIVRLFESYASLLKQIPEGALSKEDDD